MAQVRRHTIEIAWFNFFFVAMTADADVANSANATVFDISINVKWIACVLGARTRTHHQSFPIGERVTCVHMWRWRSIANFFFPSEFVSIHIRTFFPFHCYDCWQWMCSVANELHRLVDRALPYHDIVWNDINSFVRSNDFCRVADLH